MKGRFTRRVTHVTREPASEIREKILLTSTNSVGNNGACECVKIFETLLHMSHTVCWKCYSRYRDDVITFITLLCYSCYCPPLYLHDIDRHYVFVLSPAIAYSRYCPPLYNQVVDRHCVFYVIAFSYSSSPICFHVVLF